MVIAQDKDIGTGRRAAQVRDAFKAVGAVIEGPKDRGEAKPVARKSRSKGSYRPRFDPTPEQDEYCRSVYLDSLTTDEYAIKAIREKFGLEVTRNQLWTRYKRKKQ